MLVSITLILVGFALLIWSSDRFVMGAAALARNLGVSPLLIGLTIVGFGTSAPEILVSGMASLQGNPGLAIGNALGSNIANIGLILGVTALVIPLVVNSDVLRKEYPILLIVSMSSYVLLMDHDLGRIDGAILLSGLFISMFLIVKIGQKRQKSDVLAQEFEDEIPSDLSTGKSIIWFCIGLVILLIGSRMLVTGAVDIAKAFGISDLVIGLTIVAVGTSLPELATSITSALKNEHELAVGNIIGSNLYNLLAVLAIPGLVSPGPVEEAVLSRDLPLMLALTLALFLMGTGRNGKGRINRLEGAILLLVFVSYQIWIYYQSIAGTN
jgi:cation:H+ antiporter